MLATLAARQGMPKYWLEPPGMMTLIKTTIAVQLRYEGIYSATYATQRS